MRMPFTGPVPKAAPGCEANPHDPLDQIEPSRTFMAGTPSRAQKTMVTGGSGSMGRCSRGHCGAPGASKYPAHASGCQKDSQSDTGAFLVAQGEEVY